VVDIEKAWPGALALPIWPAGSTRVESAAVEDVQHGAQTYGVVAAQPDTSNTEFDGIQGIARGVQFYRCPFLTTGVDPNAAPISLFASAVTDAAASLVKGDVLLIEQAAAGQRPIEVDELVWDAIRAAVAGRELVVIVPVGNAGLDLATVGGAVSVPPGTRTLDCASPDLATGAILVAAGVSGEQTGAVFGARTPNSNYGDLIDCWAWGDSILSYNCVPDDFDDSIVLTRDYTGYGGTSGAAAIIAGVVAMMQAIRRASNLPVLDARQVRTMLRKYGTPGAPPSSLANRLMPNLEAMQKELTTNAAILGTNPCDPMPGPGINPG
jgi:subtilisin family serine protease